MADPNMRVFPEPRNMELSGGTIAVTEGWRLSRECEAAARLEEEYAQKLGVPTSGEGKPFRLAQSDAPDEAYRISVRPDEVVVSAASESGFRFALRTLEQTLMDGRLPAGVIEDSPELRIRGVHLSLHRQYTVTDIKTIIEIAARFKLNTLILEYNARFPYEEHAAVCAANAFSREDVQEILRHARSRGLDVIPLQQSLGHLNYVLRHDAYASIREENEARAQMCPLNPRSFETFVALAEETLSLHSDARFMHIGGDETRQLGECPKCREVMERSGKAALYGPYMRKALQWVLDRGLRPIIWDDMLCKHPEALADLPRETVIMYWEYWTTADPCPYFVAGFDKNGARRVLRDQRWGNEWPFTELADVTRETLQQFSAPADLEDELGDRFMQTYGPYLGESFPRRIRAFPYLEFFQDQGFDVIAGPTMMGNHHWVLGLPHFNRFMRNIHAFAKRCKENGKALGLVTTSWYPWPPDLLHHGVAVTGQFTWSERE